MGGRMFAAGLAGLAISGCTTTSFAPPEIEMRNKVTGVEAGTCIVTTESGGIKDDVAGAMVLIDNVLASYHCAARDVANGRQAFEIPSFLALIAAGVGGPVYGLSQNEVLAAGAYSAVMGRANSYFAPKDKANVLFAAIDGVLCIQNASVGYDYLDGNAGGSGNQQALAGATTLQKDVLGVVEKKITAIEAELAERGLTTERSKALKLQLTEMRDLETALARQMGVMALDAGVTIDPALAYFKLVKGGLYQVDRVIAKRLSDSGTFDAAGIVAELEKYNGQQRKAEDDKEGFIGGTKTPPPGLLSTQEALINVELDELDARIQKCVVLAKTR